jgi:hypothetical protein
MREDYITFITQEENLVQFLLYVTQITLHRDTAQGDHCHQPTINSLIFRKEISEGNASSIPVTQQAGIGSLMATADGRAHE